MSKLNKLFFEFEYGLMIYGIVLSLVPIRKVFDLRLVLAWWLIFKISFCKPYLFTEYLLA